MKYIILQTKDGVHLPIIFPDCLVHAIVAGAMQMAVDCLDPTKDLRPKQCDRLLEAGTAKVTSAGFVSLGMDVQTFGNSESLGAAPREGDAARIVLGDTIGFMPDESALQMLEMIKAAKL